jgi:hypothetical protein
MRCHPLFHVWSPDEVAECLPGVTPEEYEVLWGHVADLPKNTSEVPDSFADRALERVWDKLPPSMRRHLFDLAVAFES